MVRFATKVYGRFSFNYFTRNFDNLLVGWRFSAQALGFYKKAYVLFAMSSVLQGFTNVAVSALSRLTSDRERYKMHLLSAISVWAFLGMAVGGVLTLGGRDLIRILLGPQWQTAGEIFTFFGPGFGAMFIYGIHGWIHLSIGKPGRWFRWGILEFLVTGSMFVFSLKWGPSAVAISWSASLLILTLPAIAYAGRPVGLHTYAVIGAVWRPCVAAVASAIATANILHVFASGAASNVGQAALRLIEISVVFTAMYLVIVCCLHGGVAPLRQIAGLLREMIGRSRTSAIPAESPASK
jgi:PST family polysaccharide transporter